MSRAVRDGRARRAGTPLSGGPSAEGTDRSCSAAAREEPRREGRVPVGGRAASHRAPATARWVLPGRHGSSGRVPAAQLGCESFPGPPRATGTAFPPPAPELGGRMWPLDPGQVPSRLLAQLPPISATPGMPRPPLLGQDPSPRPGLGCTRRPVPPRPSGWEHGAEQVTAVGPFCSRNAAGAHLPAPGAARGGGSVPLQLRSPFPILPLPALPWSEPSGSGPSRGAEPDRAQGSCPPAPVPCSRRCGGRV